MALYVDIEKELPGFTLKASFETHEMSVLGLLGASGSGKSMTLKCLAGLESPTKGHISLNNRVLYDSQKGINVPARHRHMGLLFQNYALFPHMTIKGNMRLGLGHLSKRQREELTQEFIKKVGLEGMEERYPWQLSGGQQQRVALARALSTSPDVLLLDEPFSALDYTMRRSLEEEVINLLADYKGEVIFVTHDLSEAYRVCKEIIVYNHGEASRQRGREELFKSPSSYAEAEVTGCRNLSRAEWLDEHTLYAKEWGCTLRVADRLKKPIQYVGIRAHHIAYSKNEENTNKVTFNIHRIVKNPFDYTFYLRPPGKAYTKGIQWDTRVHLNLDFNQKQVTVYLSPKALFTF